MIEIAIAAEAFEAIVANLPIGRVAAEDLADPMDDRKATT
jgi:hypothetical protein